MDIREFNNSFDELQKELDGALRSADPSISFLLKSQNLLITNLMSTTSDLLRQNDALNSTIKSLQETIKDLQRQLRQNSQNSSKPPSSDGYKKTTKSLRTPSGKKPGGQKGHGGAHMKLPHEPDEVISHVPEKCKTCPFLAQCMQSEKVFSCGEKRNEVNIEVITKVTEHRVLKIRECPCGCPKGLRGEFPAGINAYAQYGNSVAVWASLMNTFGAVSIKRCAAMLNALTGGSLSEGTLAKMVAKCSSTLDGTLGKIKLALQGSKVVHFDETGVSVGGRLHWVHDSSSDRHTYLTVNEKRGYEGIMDNGVLPEFGGVAEHDCWPAYFKFGNARHAVCNVHILRELNGVIENEPSQTWATLFRAYLLKLLKAKKESPGNKLSEEAIKIFESEYDEIMKKADIEFPAPEIDASAKKRGRIKKGRTRALIERLMKYKDEVILFIKDGDVPFSNNQAERDVRNVKTKSKIAGCFRTLDGAKNYLKIMSVIGTAAKAGIDAFKALTAAFAGNADIVLGGSE